MLSEKNPYIIVVSPRKIGKQIEFQSKCTYNVLLPFIGLSNLSSLKVTTEKV